MKPDDIAHISDEYINAQDLSEYMTTEIVRDIKKAFSAIKADKSAKQIRRLAEPCESGNTKRIMFLYLAKNGYINYPSKEYAPIMVYNNHGKKDPRLKGVYAKRCVCGKRPYVDRCVGYSVWLICSCGRKGNNGDTLTDALENWNNHQITYS